jgi:asparagine synthase (glutamine-hydrolysing)
MCGIAGFASNHPAPGGEVWLGRMTDSIRHRGPDDSGHFFDGPVALGHRRLSIIDLAGGHQPMSNEDGACWIVFNGEIFNHHDLRPDLEAAGHRYRSRCDTETIIHAWEQYGPDCVQRFRGMFAFAIWDRPRQTLFCARDRLGIKPFYYYWDGRLFVFASEIKALLEHPEISARLNEAALAEYLTFGYSSGEQTLFAGIRKLMPGHHLGLELREGAEARLVTQRYWEVPAPPPGERRDDRSWIEECRRRLEETVRMRLMSDVPLGMFLSGGVDSSAIAALMKRMVSMPVKTFSVGYRETEYSELSYARQVAGALGTEHHEISVGMDDFWGALPRLIWHEDEPIAWPSSVSLYFVSRLAARHVKVVLTGEGSDELFGGYARYRFYLLMRRWLGLYRVVPGPLRRALRDWIATSRWLAAPWRRKLQHTPLGAGESLEELYLDNFYSALRRPDVERLFAGVDANLAYAGFRQWWDGGGERTLLGRMLYADQKTYLVELLMKQDQMSMACSIESRVPFLDHPLVEFAARVPDRLKIRGGSGKHIFKEAVRDLLPPGIVDRKKMGFPTPLHSWLLEARAAPLFDLLSDPDGLLAGYVDRKGLQSLLQAHRNREHDATDRIWRLLNLQIWGDVFLTGRRSRRWPELLGDFAPLAP